MGIYLLLVFGVANKHVKLVCQYLRANGLFGVKSIAIMILCFLCECVYIMQVYVDIFYIVCTLHKRVCNCSPFLLGFTFVIAA